MENEYNYLEQKLGENEIKDNEKIRILERQKELLLQFLIDSNRELFELLTKEEIKLINKDVFLLVNPIKRVS